MLCLRSTLAVILTAGGVSLGGASALAADAQRGDEAKSGYDHTTHFSLQKRNRPNPWRAEPVEALLVLAPSGAKRNRPFDKLRANGRLNGL